MREDFQRELDKKRFSLVRYGLVFILLTLAAVLLSLILIKIEGQSILSMVVKYYFR